MAAYQPHVCEHGNSSSCPHDVLAQVRMRNPSWVDGPNDAPWRTVTVWACDAQGWRTGSWRSVWAKRRHETRTIRVGDE